MQNITGLIDSPTQYFLESSLSLHENQSIHDLSAEILEMHIFHYLNVEELAKIATVCRLWNALASSDWSLNNMIPPPWLTNIELDTLGIDFTKYGIDVRSDPRKNRRELTKRLKPLSGRVENNMGITNLDSLEGLTLNKVLQIAKDYSVPISPYFFDRILTELGDIPVKQTCGKFYTNSILTGTRKRTPDEHDLDVTTIGKECKISIQKHNVRDLMWLLVCTYLSSPDRIQLYSSATYTRLLEKVNNWSLSGGFAPSGLEARVTGHDFVNAGIGVGASGSSEDIGTRDMGT
jgi:hypothetical protein